MGRAASILMFRASIPSRQYSRSQWQSAGVCVPVLISDKVYYLAGIVADGAGLVGADTIEGTYDPIAGWFSCLGRSKPLMRIARCAASKQR